MWLLHEKITWKYWHILNKVSFTYHCTVVRECKHHRCNSLLCSPVLWSPCEDMAYSTVLPKLDSWCSTLTSLLALQHIQHQLYKHQNTRENVWLHISLQIYMNAEESSIAPSFLFIGYNSKLEYHILATDLHKTNTFLLNESTSLLAYTSRRQLTI